MTSLSAPVPQPMRSPWSFMGSICLHAWVLAWVAVGPSLPLEPAKSLYETEIQPSEKHIVWYKLTDRLPDVTPPEAKHDARPLRAKTKFDQNMAAGRRDLASPPQLILAPAPEITPAKPLPLPNIVAIAPPQRPPALLFIPPPVQEPTPALKPRLPDAPNVAAAKLEVRAPALDLKTPPPVRKFTPLKKPKSTPSEPAPLPEAPKVAAATPEIKAPATDVKAPPPVRKFTPLKKPTSTPSEPAPLPEAPKVAAATPEIKAPAIDVKAPPPVRKFTPLKKPKSTPSEPAPLPEAPKVAAATPEIKAPAIDVKAPPPVRKFTPIREPRSTPSEPAPLPEAPKVAAATPEVKAPAIDVKAPPPVRKFTPIREPRSTPSEPAPLPEAPKVAAATPEVKAPAFDVKAPRPIRSFTQPRQSKEPAKSEPGVIATPPPPLTAAGAMPSENSLVIAGLNPAKSVEVPAPPGSVKAGFSGGPKPEPKGGEGTPTGAMLEIPSLTIQGGDKNPQQPVMVARVSPTSREALAAALRDARAPAPATGSATRQAVRVASVPDPRMYGRQVYSMAIQVPNLTSYSGSWLVWFAGRERDMGNPSVEMHPPLPVHMVSPKYVNSAMEERVEGKVRLWAVIGKDGRVGNISLLEHLDDRLDRAAEEALGKWLFQPAVRNGVVVDVDAVFEIPFNLAPKPQR